MPVSEFFTQYQTYFYIGGELLLLCLLGIIVHRCRPLPERIASRIRRKQYISKEDFFQSWKQSKKDFPGCYVILIYDKKLILNPMHYDDIYVGQSVNVRKRVFSHLMGHGNGNVYYGLKSGCRVYVIIARCRKKKLNQSEKELIQYFNATTSLNMTRGGAPSR